MLRDEGGLIKGNSELSVAFPENNLACQMMFFKRDIYESPRLRFETCISIKHCKWMGGWAALLSKREFQYWDKFMCVSVPGNQCTLALTSWVHTSANAVLMKPFITDRKSVV